MKSLLILVTSFFLAASSDNQKVKYTNIYDFFQQSYEQELALSPVSQTSKGLKTNYGKLDDFSKENFDKYTELTIKNLQTIHQFFPFEQLAPKEQDYFLQFVEFNQQGLDLKDIFLKDYVESHFQSAMAWIPSFLANSHSIKNISEAEAYISRLHEIKRMGMQLANRLNEQVEEGIVAPALSYELTLVTLHNIISGAPFDKSNKVSVFLSDFSRKVSALDIKSEKKNQLIQQAREALLTSTYEGYWAVIDAVNNANKVANGRNRGLWSIPGGLELYSKYLKFHTSTDLTADEIHQVGLSEVKRIHGEIQGIMEQVGFDGTLSEFFVFLRTDPQFYYPNTEEGKQVYLERSKQVIEEMRQRLPKMFYTFPKAPLEVRAVERWREGSAGGGFYQGPSPDGSRPGIYYVNLKDMNKVPIFELEDLAYHEGLPGHHMQIAIAKELQDVPEFKKNAWVTAFGEGWALYSEKLSKEFGAFQDPYSDYGRLSYELLRAVRLVVDTGIHSKKWSMQKAVEYMVENMSIAEYQAKKAILRYLVMPGQATAYKVGMMKILELRAYAKNQLKEKFDIREFHDVLLTNGSVTLKTLERHVEEWVLSVKRGTSLQVINQ